MLTFLQENIISSAGFAGSGLNDIFHWLAHVEIVDRSLLRSDALLKGLKTVENKEVSSAKNLILHLISFSRSLTKTRNSKGPRTDPCGTPDKIVFI